jgi:hypothetical protein
LSELPFTEMAPVGTIIYQHKTSYTNSSQSTIISYDENNQYIDWRKPNTFTPTF